MLITIVAINKLEIHQTHVKIAFLSGDLDEVLMNKKIKYLSLLNYYMV
jgi:hypothetical protein